MSRLLHSLKQRTSTCKRKRRKSDAQSEHKIYASAIMKGCFCKKQSDANTRKTLMGKHMWLLWQIIHHCIQHFTVGSTLEGGKAKSLKKKGGEKWGKKVLKMRTFWLSWNPTHRKDSRCSWTPGQTHSWAALLVLSRNSAEVCSLHYSGVKVPLTQQLRRSSEGNWSH